MALSVFMAERRQHPTAHVNPGFQSILLTILSYFLKVVLSMVVVHLHESDYVAADNCYKDSFEYVKLAVLH